MLVPELFAHVRQFEPGIDQDRLAVAGFDQPAQIFVGLGVLLVVMPAGHVQRADAGFAPALGEIIEIDARAIGAIEEGPQALAAEGRLARRDRGGLAAGRGSAHILPCRAGRRSTARRPSRDAAPPSRAHGPSVRRRGRMRPWADRRRDFERRSPRRWTAWARADRRCCARPRAWWLV